MLQVEIQCDVRSNYSIFAELAMKNGDEERVHWHLESESHLHQIIWQNDEKLYNDLW